MEVLFLSIDMETHLWLRICLSPALIA